MSDFELFNQMLAEQDVKSNEDNVIITCRHITSRFEKDIEICEDCGEELIQENNKITDIKYTSDIHNIQGRRSDERTIFKDVSVMGFTEKIVNFANDLYMNVTSSNIFRGVVRRGIVFACIYYSFKECDDPQCYETLIQLFNLKAKDGSKGIKFYNMNLKFKKDELVNKSADISSNGDIVIKSFIQNIMNSLNGTNLQIQEVQDLFYKIRNLSSQLNRCRPKSLASSLVYYWLIQKKSNISLDTFALKVNLSPLTIKKNSIEIANIIK